MMLISYFTSKKSGASTSKSAMIAAGVGAATHYTATQTEWGQNLVSDIDKKWTQLTDGGAPLTNSDGTPATAPGGATAVKNTDGSIARDAAGNVLYKLADTTIKTAGDTLQSWGGLGTATVIGASSVASDSSSWWKWAALGVVALMVIK